MIDLKELERRLDEALAKETESSLKEWLLNQRNGNISCYEFNSSFSYESFSDLNIEDTLMETLFCNNTKIDLVEPDLNASFIFDLSNDSMEYNETFNNLIAA